MKWVRKRERKREGDRKKKEGERKGDRKKMRVKERERHQKLCTDETCTDISDNAAVPYKPITAHQYLP